MASRGFRLPGRRGERLALTALVVLLLYAGLTPFDLARTNGVVWEPGGALRFDGAGIAFSEGRFRFEGLEGAPGGELSIEVWLRPLDSVRWREGTILAVSDEGSVAPLALTSRHEALTLRYRIAEEGVEGTRAISLGNALDPVSGRRHVAITSGAGGTRVYLDGVAPDRLRSRQPLVDPERGLAGRLVLGNSAQGTSGWVGELYGVALYDRALREAEVVEHAARVRDQGVRSLADESGLRALYVFDLPGARSISNLTSSETPLRVPAWFEALRWDVLRVPPAVSPLRSPFILRDILLNLFGFVPLGMLLMWIVREPGLSFMTRFVLACALGGAVSLAIELGQALLPTRHSDVLDLALNVLGTAIGALLVGLGARLWAGAPQTPPVDSSA